ncbi:MAG TPA: hypothetical protein VJM15_03290 [Sphingomicrobium sp.]|nr:hypothetical protein [Sphingomicrobium sp.]
MRVLFPALLFAAVPAAAAPSPTTPTLPIAGWWEKITVTMNGEGKAQSCKYETNRSAGSSPDCEVVGGPVSAVKTGGLRSEVSKITFERQFSPGPAEPADGELQPGDKLLGRQVMALAIDAAGKVSDCEIVAADGDLGLAYGCEEAAAERFEASAGGEWAKPMPAFMTIRIYGHSEQVA